MEWKLIMEWIIDECNNSYWFALQIGAFLGLIVRTILFLKGYKYK